VRPQLYQPFRLSVRINILIFWAVIGVAMFTTGSGEPNPPFGLVLLGFGLAGPGVLALLALASAALRARLVDPELEARRARIHLALIAALGAAGAVMMGLGLHRLLTPAL
jgi:hypothetical protein